MGRGCQLPRTLAVLAAFCAGWEPAPAAAGTQPGTPVVVVADDRDPRARMLHHAVADALSELPNYQLVYADRPSSKHARAQKHLQQAEALRRSGRTLFDSLELDGSVRDYSKALQRVDKNIAWEQDLSPLVESLSMLAAAHLLLGSEKRARGFLERLLILRPNFRPDEAIFNPTMLEVFGSEVRAVEKLPAVRFTVASEPQGAAVYVDGTFVGLSPITLSRPRGRHYVRLEAPGHEIAARPVDLKKDDQTLKLTPPSSPSAETTLRLMKEAVASASEPVMGDAALDLAELAGAKEVAIVITGSPNRLVRYRAGGSERLDTEADGNPADADVARHIAAELVDASRARSTPFVAATPRDDGDDDDDDADDGEAVVTHATRAGDAPGSGDKTIVVMSTYGAAAAFAATGGVFGFLALQDQNEYDKETAIDNKIDHGNTTDQVEGEAISESGKRKALIADILYGVAVATAITGLVLHMAWDPAPSKGDASTASSVSVGPGWLRVDF